MVKSRSEEELDLMRESGRITSIALKKVLANIKEEVTGLELDKIAEEEIHKLGGLSSFKTVPGYHHTICITFNEEVVHGLPTTRKIKAGDIVSIDIGAVFKGWHTDSAWSVLVGRDEEKENFLRAGQEALRQGVEQAVEGKKIGDISAAIQNRIERDGFGVVRSLVGHGVGKALHEEPEVPGYGRVGSGMNLKQGMSLAVEVIYTKGNFEVRMEKDGWTISTLDKSLSGLFEVSLIVGKKQAEILTVYPIVG